MLVVVYTQKADVVLSRIAKLKPPRQVTIKHCADRESVKDALAEVLIAVLLLEPSADSRELFAELMGSDMKQRIMQTVVINVSVHAVVPIAEFLAISPVEYVCLSAPNHLLWKRIFSTDPQPKSSIDRKGFNPPSLTVDQQSNTLDHDAERGATQPRTSIQDILSVQKMKISTPRNPRHTMHEVGVTLKEIENLIANAYQGTLTSANVKARLSETLNALHSWAPPSSCFSQAASLSLSGSNHSKQDSLLFEQDPSLPALIAALQSRLIAFPIESGIDVKEALSKGCELALDVFQYSHEQLLMLCYQAFLDLGLLETFRVEPETLKRFISAVGSSYRKNPYHNFEHAVDVFLNAYFFANCETVKQYLQPIDIFSLLVSSLAHDIDHPGCNNAFEINTSSSLALRYNDTSILENHHASYLFSMLQDPQYNIISGLTSEEFKEFRRVVVKSILSTDMALHYDTLAKFVRRLDSDDPFASPASKEDRQIIVNLFLHFIDICNACKPWEIHKRWQDVLLEEFFLQGDRERSLGLPLTNFCDRNHPNPIPLAINFMDHFITPLFSNISRFVPELNEVAGVQLASNRERWAEKQLAEHMSKRRDHHPLERQHSGLGSRPF